MLHASQAVALHMVMDLAWLELIFAGLIRTGDPRKKNKKNQTGGPRYAPTLWLCRLTYYFAGCVDYRRVQYCFMSGHAGCFEISPSYRSHFSIILEPFKYSCLPS